MKTLSFITRHPIKIDKTLIRNIGYLGIANIIYGIARWILIIVTTKIGGVITTSHLSLGLAVAIPIMTFTGAGLRVIITADVEKKFSFGEYLGARFLLNFIGFIGIILFSLISGYSPETVLVVILIGITKLIEGVQEVSWGIAQRNEKMEIVGKSKIFREVGMVLFVTVGLMFFKSLVTAIVLWIIYWIILYILYDLPRTCEIEKLSIHWQWLAWWNIAMRSTPLAIVWGTLALNEKVGQYLLSWIHGEEVVGYYAPLMYVVQVGGIVSSSLSEAMIPRLARYFRDDRKRFSMEGLKLTGLGISIAIAMLLGTLLIGKPLLSIIYRPEYVQYYDVFLLILVIAIFRYAFDGLGRAITAAGVFWMQVPMTLANLLVTVIMGLFLIPTYSLMGAVASTGVGLLVSLCIMVFIFIKVGLLGKKNEVTIHVKG